MKNRFRSPLLLALAIALIALACFPQASRQIGKDRTDQLEAIYTRESHDPCAPREQGQPVRTRGNLPGTPEGTAFSASACFSVIPPNGSVPLSTGTVHIAAPQAARTGFLPAQRPNAPVFVVLFLLLGISVLAFMFLRGRRQSQTARMELQAREYMFDMLSRNVDDIVLMFQAQDRHVDYISPNVERLLGISPEEIRRNVPAILRCAPEEDRTALRAALNGIPSRGSYTRGCPFTHQGTGEQRWYRATIYRTPMQAGERYIVVLSDRTREKEMNRQLQDALDDARSANEAKSNFLANMSHDIRTPMNAIVGFATLLEKDADRPEKVREYSRKISASSRHLLGLINDVLDMSKIESGRTSLNVNCFRLSELVEDLKTIIGPQAKAKNQSMVFRADTRADEVLGDRLRVNQILINLLSNAVKYTPEGGAISFRTEELPRSSPGYASLRFTVKDNGIGMSPEFLQKIFTPFSREVSSLTNTVQGTGLGMAIARNLVDLMGGIIRVESSPGAGSTFTVELSFALPENEEDRTWFRERVSRMLVADDEADICLEIREIMEDAGVEVTWVTDGASAVDRVLQARQENRDFSVILLDWKMPGLSGVETARRIREAVGPEAPILVLTSYDWSDIEEEAREAGIRAFLPKPFFLATFLEILRPLFTEPPALPGAETPTRTPSDTLEGLRFLVAEDNALNLEILTDLLELEGARCETALNGQEALRRFRESPPGYYDMILMDVQMPVMNGYDATRAIRACDHPEAQTIPIAAMTANTFAEDVRNAMDAGMDGHLSKPLDMDQLRRLAAMLVRRSRENREDLPGEPAPPEEPAV